MANDYWEDFKKTGRVDSYLMYKQALVDGRENEWTPLKQELSSQEEQTTANQTVC